ncbi:hypothetical protein T492DRAFT_871887 [Pavlovales sp. CCMP2436]|nr:hypothetical protein T492DRAFT_871887 [Pavlovales sp. CCMP2436]
MPLLVRLSLASGALLQVVSVFGAIIFTSTCFVKFQMTDTVGETLLHTDTVPTANQFRNTTIDD